MQSKLYLTDRVAQDAANLEAVFLVRVVVCPMLRARHGDVRYTLSMAPDVTIRDLTAVQARAVLHAIGRAVSTARIEEALGC